jgi:hypothetical protein
MRLRVELQAVPAFVGGSDEPIRAELVRLERLEQRAESLEQRTP